MNPYWEVLVRFDKYRASVRDLLTKADFSNMTKEELVNSLRLVELAEPCPTCNNPRHPLISCLEAYQKVNK